MGTINPNNINSINFNESTCKKNISALINSPFRVSTDILNKTTRSQANLIPMTIDKYLTSETTRPLLSFLRIDMWNRDTIKNVTMLIVLAESTPVKIPGQIGVISTISLNER